MTLKELIYEEISKIEEDNLDELYEFVKCFAKKNSTARPKSGILSKLKRIKIQVNLVKCDRVLTKAGSQNNHNALDA